MAKPNTYQVDLILFANPQNANSNESAIKIPLLPISKNAISLKPHSTNLYGLLPPSQSGLRNEYYLLSRKSPYQVLAQYSWKQAANNQKSVAIPSTSINGWLIQGTLRLRQQGYYLFDADLQLSPPNAPESSFRVTQKQRLKNDLVYFFDNPRVGMLVRVHA